MYKKNYIVILLYCFIKVYVFLANTILIIIISFFFYRQYKTSQFVAILRFVHLTMDIAVLLTVDLTQSNRRAAFACTYISQQ